MKDNNEKSTKEYMASLVSSGIDDLNGFFHQIKYSHRLAGMPGTTTLETLFTMLVSFSVNNFVEIASKAKFVDERDGREVPRAQRVEMVREGL